MLAEWRKGRTEVGRVVPPNYPQCPPGVMQEGCLNKALGKAERAGVAQQGQRLA